MEKINCEHKKNDHEKFKLLVFWGWYDKIFNVKSIGFYLGHAHKI